MADDAASDTGGGRRADQRDHSGQRDDPARPDGGRPDGGRRAELADAALRVLAREGGRGLTHRAVDAEAGVPTGTASNYFRSRPALLGAVADRIAVRIAPAPAVPGARAPSRALFAAHLRDIVRRLTRHRDLALALFELRLEFDAGRDLGTLPMLGVGLIEETSKLIIPLAVLVLLPRLRTRANGLLIGVAAGAGFAALETMGYAFTTLITSHGSITDTVDTLLLRGFLSPAGHMAWTGITAAALFAAAASGWQGRRIAEFGIAFVVAVGLHGLWDSQNTLLGMAAVAVVSLAVLGVAVHRSVGDLANRGTRVPIGVGTE